MASRKDYVAIAEAIAEEVRSAQTWLESDDVDEGNKEIASIRLQCATRIARGIACNLSNENSTFRSTRFLKACGVD